MITKNIFEIASERKFRFPYNGSISVEDLFDLTKAQLNSIYQTLNSLVKSKETTLLDVTTSEDKDLSIKIEIVKYIFNKKVIMENIALQAQVTRAKKQQIMEIIGKKQDESLENTPVEELKQMLDDL